jgi:transcriptional regulator with GAF, ATPase, and Fis domain
MLSRLSEDLPEEAIAEREYFSRTGVKSLLAIPVRVGESVTCAMACSTLRAERSWGSDIAARLRLLGEIFANALFRRRADERAHQAYEEIRQLKDRLQVEVTYFRRAAEPPNTFEKIVGQSDELKYVLFRTEQVAPNNTTVLILGETGTGKALIAAAIHNLSPRKARPLITVNCAALPASLIDSELFGHEKGAFTGAETRVMGRFEIADQSSLFLDEIGELPLELQAKLLRVLQTSEFERLGSAQTLKVDVRIIAASNRNLEEEVRRGRFRQDLYYRLNVFPITVPPLRQRPEDIPLLVDVFVQRLARKLGKPITSITKKTLQTLQGYAWPGNVRELESVVERAVIVSSGPTLHLADRLLAPEITVSPSRGRRLDEVERAHIVRILEETRWRISGPNGAAALLGLNPSTLRSRIHKLGIQRAASAR